MLKIMGIKINTEKEECDWSQIHNLTSAWLPCNRPASRILFHERRLTPMLIMDAWVSIMPSFRGKHTSALSQKVRNFRAFRVSQGVTWQSFQHYSWIGRLLSSPILHLGKSVSPQATRGKWRHLLGACVTREQLVYSSSQRHPTVVASAECLFGRPKSPAILKKS